MAEKINILIIDPQNDFIDEKGSLMVKGAINDMNRLSLLINNRVKDISSITLSLDNHHRFNISHPLYWVGRNGNHPNPFTIIDPSEVLDGHWVPSKKELLDISLNYLKELDKPHCIWPYHCLVGSWGSNIHESIDYAISNWETEKKDMAFKIIKGLYPYSEWFSAIEAIEPNDDNPETLPNKSALDRIENSDNTLIAGEASSHCVSETVRSIVKHRPNAISKIVLLKDAMSPVSGFEEYEDNFFNEMKILGVREGFTSDFY